MIFSFAILSLFQRFAEGYGAVFLWSDGPVAQFKNRYIYHFLNVLCSRYNLAQVQRNFFAPMHGKGAVDGIGGCAKRMVWNAVKARNCVVRNANDFCEVLRGSEISAILIDNFFTNEWVKQICIETIEEAREVSKNKFTK
jgi:hypothetical protein